MNKSSLRILVLLLAMPLFLVTCKQEYTDLGSEFIDVNTNVMLLDTFTVKLSTIQMDSIPTSGQKTILLGRCNDPEFGKITSTGYLQLTTCGSTSLDKNVATYDSICLYLRYNRYFYGDTNVLQTIKVYQLNEIMEDKDDDGYFYNTTRFEFKEDSLLRTIQYNPRPISKTRIGIKLSNDLGQDLFAKVIGKDKKSDEIIDKDDKFKKYFKGLAVVPVESDEAAVIGFYKDSTYMRLYYHNKGEEQKYLDFKMSTTDLQSNQILYERAGTDLNEFVKDTTIVSNSTDHAAFSQAGTGLVTKIEFPYIKNLQLSGRYYSILKAELIIEPIASSYTRMFPLPSKMYLSKPDPSVESWYGTIIEDPATSSSATGNLVVDWLYKKDTKYTYNVTSYVKYLLNQTSVDDNGLLFWSYNFFNTLERVKIGDRYHKDNKISLRLYFMKYEE
jgi:hypothetical protein